MEKALFIEKLLKAALAAGIEAAEVYTSDRDSFRAMTHNGEVDNYSVSNRSGLSLRGLYNGKMGYASTEAYDDEAVGMLVNGVIESAELVEDDAVQEIYRGDEKYPEVDNYAKELDNVTEKEKLDFLLETEKKALACGDERIKQVNYNMITTNSVSTRIVNSYGLDLQHHDNMAVAYVSVVAKEGNRVATGGSVACSRDFNTFSSDKLAKEAVEEALFYLNASPVPSGTYRVIIDRKCMPDLLGVFSGVFSADQAQQGMSLLAGKEGEQIAAECVTLMDDPLMPGGLASAAFDSEGVASKTKTVIDHGKLTTLLHNLKTARKAGVKSTGNASKQGYSSPITVQPTNFYFKPGEKTLDELMEDVGNGLVITDVSGLHAGANAVSGDFSLLSKGYTIENGKKGRAVEQITVAGNFYAMLKNIRAFGCDLEFNGSPIGSPSVDVGEMNVAGK